MLPIPDPIPPETLRQLHRDSVAGRGAITRLLRRVERARLKLSGGVTPLSTRRLAEIVAVRDDGLALRAEELRTTPGRQLALSFKMDGDSYFFVARVREVHPDGTVTTDFPPAVYLREAREFHRMPPEDVPGAPTEVMLRGSRGEEVRGKVKDWTYHGLCVEVPEATWSVGTKLRLARANDESGAPASYARVQHKGVATTGWARLGLTVTQVGNRGHLVLEQPASIPGAGTMETAKDDNSAIKTRIFDFVNDRGEPIRGIIDQWGEPHGAAAVVIPPAWGRTKETLGPLAAIIVETFRSAGKPVVVLRFDGSRRRGESYVPEDCRRPGHEHLRFSFTQAVADTRAALAATAARPFGCASAVLVTFSLAAVEARRVMALEADFMDGWVSVVGVADLAAALQVISGGVDYGHGLLRGLKFGKQELFGVIVDIEHSGLDAIRNGLAFLEDGRRDMATISSPITWIHGRHDGWVDLGRVRDLLECGDTSNRRLLQLPIGHQLRTSEAALQTFCFVSTEVLRMATGIMKSAQVPSLATLEKKRADERSRLQHRVVPLRPLWRDYLLGRGEFHGIEILTATDAYRDLMSLQARLLDIAGANRVLDLGAGAGDFAVSLARSGCRPDAQVFALDFVPEALRHGRERLRALDGQAPKVEMLAADLDLGAADLAIPVSTGSFDAAIASLLISYLKHPEAFLREVFRLLRPGGGLVLSTLRRDADISKLYADSVVERYSDRPREAFGDEGESHVDRSLPEFLNAASRILDLEEKGQFHFFDAGELRDLVSECGFVHVSTATALGDPPQAIVLKAERP